jgi:uncharacterized iron-regulated membrane protein
MNKFMRALHNYLGLILCIQIGLWFLSGLVMAYLPIEEVRGSHLRTNINTAWHNATVSPSTILSQHSEKASIAMTYRLHQQVDALSSYPVYEVRDLGSVYRYSALDGLRIAPIDKETINALAGQQYRGEGTLKESVLITELPQEVQNLTAPLWQVAFDDDNGTRFYLDPNTGAVQRVRTDTWRLFDFMWMLHIMDYKDRSNFNSPLLIGFSTSALLFTLTGIVLLYHRFRPRRRRSIFTRQSL